MIAVPLVRVPDGCVVVVVAVVVADIGVGVAGVMVIVGVGSGGLVVKDVVPDPSAGVSSGWSTSIGVAGERVGPTPSPRGTGLIVYHSFFSLTAIYTQRRSSLIKWIGRYSLSLCEKM